MSKSVQRDAAGRIYTRIQLQLADVWKGEARTNSFAVVQSGGVLGEEIAGTDGQAEFAPGEEVVLFLRVNERGEGVVIGLVQGKFEVTKERSGEKMVHNVFHGRPAGEVQSEKAQRLPLESLKQRVRGGGK
jgi:hypothetical protein